MVKVTYVEHDGTEHTIDADAGKTLMQNALDNLIPGIDGDCGGACACATCHVFVADEWLSKTGEQDTMEKDMLEFAEGVQDNSRLCCQIEITDALEGITVQMPASQH